MYLLFILTKILVTRRKQTVRHDKWNLISTFISQNILNFNTISQFFCLKSPCVRPRRCSNSMYYSMEYFYSFDLQYFHSVCYFKTISFWKIRSNLLSDSISKIKQTLFYFIIFQTIFFLSKAKKIINHLNHQQLQQCLVITFHQWDDNNDQHQVLLSNCFPSVFWAFWHGFKVDNQPLVLKSALQEMRGKKCTTLEYFQCNVKSAI